MEPMKHEPPPAALIERAKKKTRERIRADREGAPEDVAEILGAIEKGIFGRGFDVNDVRRAFAPSAETLRAFRARVGGAFKSYVTERLLEAAERLVDEPGIDPAEIAEGLGFARADRFSRWFKRWTGATPEQRRAALPQRRPADPAAVEPLPDVWFRVRVAALRCGEAAPLSEVIRRAGTAAAKRRRGSS